MFTWAQRRKLLVFLIFFILAASVTTFFILKIFEPAPPPPLEGFPLSVLWARFFELRDGFVDVAALVKNQNNFAAEKIIYSFKIYDRNNILVAIKEGETFARALEEFVIFEPNINVKERSAGKVILDIKNVIFDENLILTEPRIDVLGTEKFLEDFFPRVVVQIKNREGKFLDNVEATIILFDKIGNALAVSRTKIPFLGIEEERGITFTWPKPISGVSSVNIFFR